MGPPSRIERSHGIELAATHLAAEKRRMRRPEIAAIAKGEAAGALQPVCVLGVLAVAGRDDEAVLVVGDGEIAVHVLDLRHAEPGLRQHGGAVALAELALAEVDAHGQHPLQRRDDRRLGASGEQVGKVAHRDAQRAHVRNLSHRLDRAGIGMRLDGRKRRHVPDHGQRAVFGMQRKGDLPVHRHLIGGRAPCRLDPIVGDAVGTGLLDDRRIVRIEKELELRLVEVLLILHGGRALDAVGVVEEHAEIADAADAGLRADGRLAGLDARIAEDALLRLSRGPVVIDLLVRTARHAHAPAAALVLVDEDDAVLLALVDRAGGAGGDAARVEAVLAQARQVHHEGVLELAVDVLLHRLEIVVLRALVELAAEDLLPVRPPFDLLHRPAGDQRQGPGDRCGRELGCLLQMFVVEGERLVIVVDLRHVRIGEDLRQHGQPAALLRHDLPVLLPLPAAVPAFLVLPILGIADAGLCLDIVEPGVFHALARGPHLLAGNGAGVAADAFVEVQHHRDLCADLHDAVSSATGSTGLEWSSHSTLTSLRTTTNSSRFEPTVP